MASHAAVLHVAPQALVASYPLLTRLTFVLCSGLVASPAFCCLHCCMEYVTLFLHEADRKLQHHAICALLLPATCRM